MNLKREDDVHHAYIAQLIGVSRRTCVALTLLGAATVAIAQNEPVATQFRESADGIGHMLVVPYYTVQSGNVTLLNIVNTDMVNGKAVKVRFRAASNADDVFNFTLFLSPGDVWAAEINQNPATGRARLSTPDDSCTLPTNVNQDFNTIRLNRTADVARESREGYVDIITMADVVPDTALYTAITHEDGKLPAACSGGAATPAALQALLTTAGINTAGFGAPTSGLLANWSILNVSNALSWAGAATAIVAVDAGGIQGKGRVVVFPQTSGAPSETVGNLTSDPLLSTGAITAQHSDFPDLSTPYLDGITALQQASMLSGALAKSSVRNEYFIDKTVQAATDWVMVLPTRRYSLGVDYVKGQIVYSNLPKPYFSETNVSFSWDMDFGYGGACVFRTPDGYWSRSGKSVAYDPFIILWDIFHGQMPLCDAVSIWSIRGDSGQGGAVLANTIGPYTREVLYDPSSGAGWGEVQTPGLNGAGLPLIGAAFAKATSPDIGAGISGNFGLVWPHRYTRPGL